MHSDWVEHSLKRTDLILFKIKTLINFSNFRKQNFRSKEDRLYIEWRTGGGGYPLFSTISSIFVTWYYYVRYRLYFLLRPSLLLSLYLSLSLLLITHYSSSYSNDMLTIIIMIKLWSKIIILLYYYKIIIY